jgi:hypothetical protein
LQPAIVVSLEKHWTELQTLVLTLLPSPEKARTTKENSFLVLSLAANHAPRTLQPAMVASLEKDSTELPIHVWTKLLSPEKARTTKENSFLVLSLAANHAPRTLQPAIVASLEKHWTELQTLVLTLLPSPEKARTTKENSFLVLFPTVSPVLRAAQFAKSALVVPICLTTTA